MKSHFKLLSHLNFLKQFIFSIYVDNCLVGYSTSLNYIYKYINDSNILNYKIQKLSPLDNLYYNIEKLDYPFINNNQHTQILYLYFHVGYIDQECTILGNIHTFTDNIDTTLPTFNSIIFKSLSICSYDYDNIIILINNV